MGAIAVHLLGVPVYIVADALNAGLIEGFGLDDDVLVHGDQVLALDNDFGYRVLQSDASDASTPANFCQRG
jgi:hypothetical protein